MFRAMAAGLVMAAGLACVANGPAWAAGPLSVDTAFDSGVSPGDPYKADLAALGVTVQLASDTFVTVDQPANLTFRLLESHVNTNGVQITTLVVGGVDYDFGIQGFTAPGTLLGSQLFSGAFTDLVGFRDADMPADAPPIAWPDAFKVYIRGADQGNFTGIGPFIGNFDTLYFNIAGLALFEVTATTVPEPATWALLVLGFGSAGAVLRNRRRSRAENQRPHGCAV